MLQTTNNAMPQTIFTPSICRVNLGAIQRNFARLGQPHKLMPVIKSDAYGHGLIPVAQALDQCGAANFAVGLASEGASLRAASLSQRIVLLMGCLSPDDWRLACQLDLTPIIGSKADAEAAEAACIAAGKNLDIAVKCDTGMGRLGFASTDAACAVEILRAAPHLRPQMVLSHFACADMPRKVDYTIAQVSKFRAFFAHLADAFPAVARSLCNSPGTLDYLEDDLSRPGLALYGGSPFGPEPLPGFEWAMSFTSPIIHIHDLEPGQSVSYGSIFTARTHMRIAVVACGYASGFPRALSNRASLLLHGRRCRQLGRICMGMCMIDVNAIPQAKPGDHAWLIGGQANPGETPVTPWEWASMLDTIPYEILCLLGGMNPRRYFDA